MRSAEALCEREFGLDFTYFDFGMYVLRGTIGHFSTQFACLFYRPFEIVAQSVDHAFVVL